MYYKQHNFIAHSSGGWKSKIKSWHIQCLLRTCFLIHKQCLLTVSSLSGRGQGAFWVTFIRYSFMMIHPHNFIVFQETMISRPHLLIPSHRDDSFSMCVLVGTDILSNATMTSQCYLFLLLHPFLLCVKSRVVDMWSFVWGTLKLGSIFNDTMIEGILYIEYCPRWKMKTDIEECRVHIVLEIFIQTWRKNPHNKFSFPAEGGFLYDLHKIVS